MATTRSPLGHVSPDAPDRHEWKCPHCGTVSFMGLAGGELTQCPPECTGYAEYPGPDFVVRMYRDGQLDRESPISAICWADPAQFRRIPDRYWHAGTTRSYVDPVWDPEQRKVVERDPNPEDSPETARPGQWETE